MSVIDLRGAEGFSADPYPHYAKLRAEGPAHQVRTDDFERVWMIVGYEEARAALADQRFSKDWRTTEQFSASSNPINANMLELDAPRHTRLRKLVSREFTARRIESLRPRVEQITGDLLDAMVPDGSADLVDAFAFPLPMTVICELLGVPDIDRDVFRALSNAIVTPVSQEKEDEAVHAMGAYLDTLVEDKRRAPGDDLMSALIQANDEDGDRLSPDELIGMAFLLLVAGHETTVNLIANGVRALLDHPEQLALLRARPELIDGAVEEMLRYDGPVATATFRFTREPVPVGPVVIPKGEAVLVALGSGTVTPTVTRIRTPSTSGGRRRAIWPSGTESTSAWAPRWPGWRAASRSARCWSAAPAWCATRTEENPTGCPGCCSGASATFRCAGEMGWAP